MPRLAADNERVPLPASHEHLARIAALRSTMILALAAALWLAHAKLGVRLPLLSLLGGIGVLLALNIVTMLRLYGLRPIGAAEIFAFLVGDAAGLFIVLYFSGGATNPFVSLYLVLLTVAAIILPRAYSWALAAIVVICCTVLMLWFEPLVHTHGAGWARFPMLDLHIVGMWVTFVLSATIIALFVVNMATGLRQRDQRLARAREEKLRSERVVALGALAAGAAHELGTPLSTIAVIAKELERHLEASDEQLQGVLRTLRAQVDVCKASLSTLVERAGLDRIEHCSAKRADVFFAETVAEWRAAQPRAKLEFIAPSGRPAPQLLAAPTLKQTVMNLLSNAAEASPGPVQVSADWNEREIALDIIDEGPGLPKDALARVGTEAFSTKAAAGAGLGIGLMLARAALEQLGGRLALSNRPEGGLHARVVMPVLAS